MRLIQPANQFPFRESIATSLAALVVGCLLAAAPAGSAADPAASTIGAPPPTATSLPKPPPTVPRRPVDSSTNAAGRLPLTMVSPGVFQIGGVRLDKTDRSVSFPAVLNMNNGPLEYFLVTAYGKKHESLLRTEVPPMQVHVAMLLLDVVNTGTNRLNAAPPTQLKNPSSAAIPGDRLAIEVSWRQDGKDVRVPAESLLYNQELKSAMPDGAWVYNGSAVWDGKFLAQREGSMVSLVTDPVALVNNSGAGRDNDRIWAPNTNSLPALNSPVRVTFRLKRSPSEK